MKEMLLEKKIEVAKKVSKRITKMAKRTKVKANSKIKTTNNNQVIVVDVVV